MRRVCLTLPTDRACAATVRAVAEEAAHGARHFDIEVHLLILDSSGAADLAAHREAVAALPPEPGVVVHHFDEDEQRDFLRGAVARSGVAAPDRVLDLMLPSGVSYGACTNRAFLIAEALGCASVHRRDSDSRYQYLDGKPVLPIHHELTAIGRRAADVAGLVSRSRLDPALADRPVAMVGGSFVGEMSVDVAEIRALDPSSTTTSSASPSRPGIRRSGGGTSSTRRSGAPGPPRSPATSPRSPPSPPRAWTCATSPSRARSTAGCRCRPPPTPSAATTSSSTWCTAPGCPVCCTTGTSSTSTRWSGVRTRDSSRTNCG